MRPEGVLSKTYIVFDESDGNWRSEMEIDPPQPLSFPPPSFISHFGGAHVEMITAAK